MVVLSVMEKIEQDKGIGSAGVEGLVWRSVVALSRVLRVEITPVTLEQSYEGGEGVSWAYIKGKVILDRRNRLRQGRTYYRSILLYLRSNKEMNVDGVV